jgi:hypothetical protein
LDYRNADGSLNSCPRLLLEPQRTNLALYSEQFNDASWLLIGATTSANVAISPGGTTNADELIGDGTNTSVRIRRNVTISAGVHTFSCFLKAGTHNFAFLEFSGFVDISGTSSAFFNLANGTTPTSGATIENYGNGWYRCYISATINLLDTAGSVGFRVVPSISTNVFSTAGDANGKSILAWGAQLEAGAYPTTYIPTTTAAVTRIADAASKTGVSSLIGQTEGTLFVDITLTSRSSFSYFAIAPNLGATNTYIGIGISASSISFEVVNSGIQVAYSFPNTSTGSFKLAFAYKANDFVAYVNGALVHTDTSGTVPTCSQIGLNAYNNAASWNYNQAALFPTRLTNAQLAQLTTL